jgi:hypothetical protein
MSPDKFPMHRLGAATSTLSLIRVTGSLMGLEIAGTRDPFRIRDGRIDSN